MRDSYRQQVARTPSAEQVMHLHHTHGADWEVTYSTTCPTRVLPA